MLDTIKTAFSALQIVPDPLRCTSVDPKEAAQTRTF